MKYSRFVIILLVISVLGCTESILKIQELSPQKGDAVGAQRAAILGIERIFAESTSRNLNILFVHGIGYTEELNKDRFGNDLIEFIQRSYGATLTTTSEVINCPGGDVSLVEKAGALRFIRAEADPTKNQSLSTDDPLRNLSIGNGSRIGCLYRDVLSFGEGRTITVFRFIWDNALWDAFEYAHVGYDDGAVGCREKTKDCPRKVENPPYDSYNELYRAREFRNKQLKDQVVTYGLTDAALYIGPLGKLLREGLRGAICAAIGNGADGKWTAGDITAGQKCLAIPDSPAPLVLMAHSLGSRVLFDVLKTDLEPDLAHLLKTSVSNKDLEVYFFANQIPLIGLGRLGTERSKETLTPKRLKFVAFSEINDLLTFELVPYFEQLACFNDPGGCDSWRENATATSYHQMSERLGFDIVDVRTQFAGPLFNVIKTFRDPSAAHSDHLKHKVVSDLLLCGTDPKSNDKLVTRTPCKLE